MFDLVGDACQRYVVVADTLDDLCDLFGITKVDLADQLRLSLYANPDAQSQVLKLLQSGDLLEIEEISGPYALVTAPGGTRGWVKRGFLVTKPTSNILLRQEQEKKTKKEGGDNPYPGYEAIREEEREEGPAILLTVRDAGGNVVRRLKAPARAGFHRIAWDFSYPSTAPVTRIGTGRGGGRFGLGGMTVAPGTFTVSMAKRVDGKITDLGMSQNFEVKPLYDRGTLPPVMTLEERRDFLAQVAELQRTVFGTSTALGDALEKLKLIKEALDRSTVETHAMREEAQQIERELMDLRIVLTGDPIIGGQREESACRHRVAVHGGDRG